MVYFVVLSREARTFTGGSHISIYTALSAVEPSVW